MIAPMERSDVSTRVGQLPEARSDIARLSSARSPNDQIAVLYYLDTTHGPRDELYDNLIDFAADPSNPYLLPRAIALDLALQYAPGDVAERVYTVLPILTDPTLEYATYGRRPELAGLSSHQAYHKVIWELLSDEGIHDTWVFPPYNYDPFGELPNRVPVHVCRLLDSMIPGSDGRYLSGSLPLASFKSMLASLLDNAAVFRSDRISDLSEQKLAQQLPQALQLARLLDFKGGRADHEWQLEIVRRGDNAEAYIDLFSRLAANVQHVPKIMPEIYRQGVGLGMESLFANLLYAVARLETSGDAVDTALPLNDQPDALPFLLKPGEALDILTSLVAVTDKLARLAHEEITPANIVSTTASDYLTGRFIDGRYHNVSYTIRPEGDYVYDRGVEYGRPGEGVEGTIGWVVDPTLSPGKLIEIGKHRRPGPDGRVSIRLDREGILLNRRSNHGAKRDPTQLQGTLSLDIGSVLGDKDWLCTKIGRFLAWGNVLRAHAVGESTQLNHVVQYFEPRHGQADVFATAARQTILWLDTGRVDRRELLRRFSSTAALKHGSQQAA